MIGTTRRTTDDTSGLINVGDISELTNWSDAVKGCDVIVHTAGRAHILNDDAVDRLTEFRRVNRDATLKLAEDAAAAGVKHFIFISSIGVNGNSTHGVPFTEQSIPQPISDYAISKLEAEKALKEKCAERGIALTVIRPALICGENAPGNIRRLLKLVSVGLPMPFRGVSNKRSMVSLDNVVNFIMTCIEDPRSKNELFVLADEDKPTTEEIIRTFADGMNKPARVIWFPSFLLNVVLRFIGKKSIYEQLYGSLDIDASYASRQLDWHPKVSIFTTMKKTAEFYVKDVK